MKAIFIYLRLIKLNNSNYMFKRLLSTILFLYTFTSINAQYSNTFNRDIGLTVGLVNFKGDFGESGNTKNYFKNNGYIITGVFYLSLNTNYHRFIDNFKLRLEASYMNCDLAHYGRWADPNDPRLFATQLKSMKGNVQSTSFGAQVEFFPFGTDEYTKEEGFIPYISLGGQLNSYSTKITSSLGPIDTPISTPIKYLNGGLRGISSDVVPSLSMSIGTRYKLTSVTSLVLDMRLQYYFSDWVDGMNPNKSKYPENKAEDWLTIINVGYIFYLE
jgi:hypothetical protein